MKNSVGFLQVGCLALYFSLLPSFGHAALVELTGFRETLKSLQGDWVLEDLSQPEGFIRVIEAYGLEKKKFDLKVVLKKNPDQDATIIEVDYKRKVILGAPTTPGLESALDVGSSTKKSYWAGLMDAAAGVRGYISTVKNTVVGTADNFFTSGKIIGEMTQEWIECESPDRKIGRRVHLSFSKSPYKITAFAHEINIDFCSSEVRIENEEPVFDLKVNASFEAGPLFPARGSATVERNIEFETEKWKAAILGVFYSMQASLE
jgi:hypothetical protein